MSGILAVRGEQSTRKTPPNPTFFDGQRSQKLFLESRHFFPNLRHELSSRRSDVQLGAPAVAFVVLHFDEHPTHQGLTNAHQIPDIHADAVGKLAMKHRPAFPQAAHDRDLLQRGAATRDRLGESAAQDDRQLQKCECRMPLQRSRQRQRPVSRTSPPWPASALSSHRPSIGAPFPAVACGESATRWRDGAMARRRDGRSSSLREQSHPTEELHGSNACAAITVGAVTRRSGKLDVEARGTR